MTSYNYIFIPEKEGLSNKLVELQSSRDVSIFTKNWTNPIMPLNWRLGSTHWQKHRIIWMEKEFHLKCSHPLQHINNINCYYRVICYYFRWPIPHAHLYTQMHAHLHRETHTPSSSNTPPPILTHPSPSTHLHQLPSTSHTSPAAPHTHIATPFFMARNLGRRETAPILSPIKSCNILGVPLLALTYWI